MNNAKILEAVIKVLPYPDQITDIELDEDNAVGFTWRGSTYRISDNLCVEKLEGRLASSDTTCMLMKELLKRA